MKSKAFELENIFKILLKEIPVNIYWKDADGYYLGCNQSVAKSCGLNSPDEIIGKTNFDFLDQEMAMLVTNNDKTVMAERREHVFEEIGVDEQQRKVYYLSMKKPIFDEHNNVVGLFGVAINNNAQKELEKAKQETKIIQEKLNAIKVAIGTLAHELRTPLASIQQAMHGIKKYFNIILKGYKLAEEHQLAVEPIRSSKFSNLESTTDRILREVYYANNFINLTLNNLRVMRIENLTIDTIDMASIIQKALENYPFDEEERALVQFNPDNNFIISGNDTYIINIFVNLLKNALYYIKEVQKGEISIWLETGIEYNKVYFKDTGKGIAPELMEHMFKEFYTTSEHGVGLGLVFCKTAMESMQGKIEIESKLGQYTQFILSFPSVEK